MNYKTITKEKYIDASTERVFKALTQKKELEQWFVPKAEIDLRTGGPFKVEFAPGMGEEGEITELKAPNLFGYTWEKLSPSATTTVFRLIGKGDGTSLKLAQSGIGTGKGWEVYATMETAWDAHLNDLASWVETGSCPPPGPRG